MPRGHSTGLVATALERVDPGSRAPRATIRLPAAGTVVTNEISDHVAVTASAVWAVGADERVRRIDPRADRVTATVAGVRARAIAASGDSLWAVARSGKVAEIDGRSGAVRARGAVSASAVASIAAGAGGAWISAPADGTAWHAVHGRGDRLVMSTVRVPAGMTDIAYGDGALWGVHPLRGTLTQVDADDGAVARTIAVGGFPRAVAVGAGAVWVATAPAAGDAPPATRAAAGIAPLPASICEEPFYGGGAPADLLVVSDLPLQGGLLISSRRMTDAIALVLRRHGFRAGRWRVAYQSCDDAVAATRIPEATKCAANARAYGRAPDVVAVVGPLNSDCALAAVPELNRAPGPLAIVSPLTSYVGLTHAGPGTRPGELRSLYPSGRRNFLRVFPADDHQVAALALLAQRLGRAPVFVLDDGDDEYGRLLAGQFARFADALELPVAGRASWRPGARSHGRLAARVARFRPGAVFLGGSLGSGGADVVKALRDRLGDRVAILAPAGGFTPLPLLVEQAGSAADGVFLSLPGIAGTDQLRPEGRRFAQTLGTALAGQEVEPSAIYAAQAMEVVLDAIARSDGTRASVLRALFATRIENGLIGSVGFDRNGDVETSPVTILRVEPGARSAAIFEDAVVDRVLDTPAPAALSGGAGRG